MHACPCARHIFVLFISVFCAACVSASKDNFCLGRRRSVLKCGKLQIVGGEKQKQKNSKRSFLPVICSHHGNVLMFLPGVLVPFILFYNVFCAVEALKSGEKGREREKRIR